MIDALQPVLFMNGFEPERIFFDRFTTSSGAVVGPLTAADLHSTQDETANQEREMKTWSPHRVRSARRRGRRDLRRFRQPPLPLLRAAAAQRATHYEDVTVDVQPDPERYLIQNWIISFPNGKGAYVKDATAGEELELARLPRARPGVGAHALSAPVEDRDDGAGRHRQRPQGRARRRRSTRPGSRSCRTISAPGSTRSSASARR